MSLFIFNISFICFLKLCYAIKELRLRGLKQPLVTSQSQAGRLDKLSQHTIIQTSYPSIQSPKHRPGKLDTLSQHAVETNHMMGK